MGNIICRNTDNNDNLKPNLTINLFKKLEVLKITKYGCVNYFKY
jgi:hypothetical protein